VLALDPVDIPVGQLPASHHHKRLFAIEQEVARRQVAGVGVVYGGPQMNGNAAYRINNLFESVEVHADKMMDIEARQRFDGIDGARRPAKRVRGVYLLCAVPGKFHLGIARDRNHDGLLVPFLQAYKHHYVAATPTALTFVAALVAADYESVDTLIGVTGQGGE